MLKACNSGNWAQLPHLKGCSGLLIAAGGLDGCVDHSLLLANGLDEGLGGSLLLLHNDLLLFQCNLQIQS